jgi:hypothetical protein
MDISLKETHERWCGVQKETVKDWYQCKRLLYIRFGTEHGRNQLQRCDGHGTPKKHLEKCRTQWRMTPLEEWSHHLFTHWKGFQQTGM